MISFDLPNSALSYYENYFEHDFFDVLKNKIQWEEKEIILFGKKVWQPRLVAFYGDEKVSYKYSGQEMWAIPWTDDLLQIKNSLKNGLGLNFNSCLLNYYRDGKDSMGWHQDNEAVLGKNPLIASLTFGCERKFKLKHISDSELKLDLVLKSKSVFVMSGETQHFYKHSIPKTNKEVGPRINLTFRTILPIY